MEIQSEKEMYSTKEIDTSWIWKSHGTYKRIRPYNDRYGGWYTYAPEKKYYETWIILRTIWDDTRYRGKTPDYDTNEIVFPLRI
ncbi:hypothetical protein FACS189485_16320 [Spirochaetia bacterium]|nr:hypothetical protein FACS189485_16320 [Spirochaetia bacterium]